MPAVKPKYWMISNRKPLAGGLGPDRGDLSYWAASSDAVDDFASWTKFDGADPNQDFIYSLIDAADRFPKLDDPLRDNEQQKHVTMFIHGFNNDWKDAARRYKEICKSLFAGPAGSSLGLCMFFTWPSDGMSTNYLPDRGDARDTAPDLAEVLSGLYDYLVVKQRAGARNSNLACKAKTSIIAHSMGNYVLQKAMQRVWTRQNQPLLVSLINQLIMVAADVDNDLFCCGEEIDKSDGDAIANLTYRITALYTGRDSVLGMSAGLKHFGKRRLGRSGLDRSTGTLHDNVWDIDCSQQFAPKEKDIHSAYFRSSKTMDMMGELLRGIDRMEMQRRKLLPIS
jgi:esterase/lipase superfamily enzyme